MADLDIVNVSAAASPPLRTRRHGYRDGSGRYTPLPHRKPVLVRETTTGQMLPGPDNSVLFRDSDGLADQLVHPVKPDFTGQLVRPYLPRRRHDG